MVYLRLVAVSPCERMLNAASAACSVRCAWVNTYLAPVRNVHASRSTTIATVFTQRAEESLSEPACEGAIQR